MPLRRKLTMDDLWALFYLIHVSVSPNDRRIAKAMRRTDKESDEFRSIIWLL